jgi:hypothetical protein
VRGSPWHAYRVEPLSTEREPEAHLDTVKLTMPPLSLTPVEHKDGRLTGLLFSLQHHRH